MHLLFFSAVIRLLSDLIRVKDVDPILIISDLSDQ